MNPIRKTNCRLFLLPALFISLGLFRSEIAIAQSVGISSSAITPDASSILELRSTTKGLLIPRLSTAERDAISAAATGLMIYNTTTGKFNFYNGSAWVAVLSGGTGVSSVTGTTNRISVGGTSADPVVDIAANYEGQNSITTLGTISTGTWNGTLISSAYGGTGNGFTKFTGPAGTEKTFTLPNASATILTDNATVTVAQGGTGAASLTGILKGNGTSAFTAATEGTDFSAGTSALATGIIKSTTGTGALSIAAPGDFPTLNQNTTGSAATLTTSRNIFGHAFNGSADLSGIISSTYGGTGNGFTKFSGATSSEKTYSLPDASTTILTKNYTGALATGIVKNTTSTGELTIAVPADFPTLNQNTTGSAATLTTSRNIFGHAFNGSADLSGIISSTYGGTGNGFTKFSGPGTAEKTFTLPDASATILTTNATVTAAQGGTGQSGYTTGDLLYASGATTLSKLAGVATGNALISGGVSTAPSWGKIGLTTHVSGILPIANGGTNASTALNNNRIMVSTSGAIREAAALTNGQLLIGSTSAAPVAATLTAGDGIAITNAAGSITIKNEPTIFMETSTTNATTTSLTDVLLTGMSITPGAGDYLVFFTGSIKNTNDHKQGTLSIYANGTKIEASEITARGHKENFFPVATNAYITGLGAGQAIEVRWNVLANTSTCYQRTLIVQRVK